MKRQTNSLTIKKLEQPADLSREASVSMLFPGVMLLGGFWGMLVQELQLSAAGYLLILPALGTMLAGVLLHWNKKRQSIAALAALVLLLLGAILLRDLFAGSIAALGSAFSRFLLLRTGRYLPPAEQTGSIWPVLLLLSALSGVAAAFVLRAKSAIWQVIGTVLVAAMWIGGVIENGLFAGVYLLGGVLVLARHASGAGERLSYSSVIAWLMAVCVLAPILLLNISGAQTALGTALQRGIHAIGYERAQNPLPEGDLRNLGAFSPSSEPALEVTMDQWTPLYLRGLVAGNYADSGWHPLPSDKLTAEAEMLHAVFSTQFFGADQIAAAWESLETESEQGVTVTTLGACRAHSYLPYGVGGVSEQLLDASDILHEGMAYPNVQSYTASIYPLEESYLLQGALAEADADAYKHAEAVYRDWVYAQYLSVPEEAYQLLMRNLSFDRSEVTTIQAKRKIVDLLAQMLTYTEKAPTRIGARDFVSYVVEVGKQGYSVHYATLATLMLRCCGIPARYVEGYLIMPAQAEAMASGETLTLTQRNAHAWTEYYLDGVGWIPFDATPGYSDILSYELPPNGIPTEDSDGTTSPLTQQDRPNPPPPTEQKEEEELPESRSVDLRLIAAVLIGILLLLLIALLLRLILLRHRLRRRRQKFASDDCRAASAAVICYLHELAALLGLRTENEATLPTAKKIAAILEDKIDAEQLAALTDEIWFSAHPVGEEQRQQALRWLAQAQTVWKEKTPLLRRLSQRFIRCDVI